MPLRKGKSREVISGNIKELVAAGHDPKQAVAAALAHSRRYADGGVVDEDEGSGGGGVEGEERSLGALNVQGKSHPEEVYNPDVEERNSRLARAIEESGDSMDYFSEGGLVEDASEGQSLEGNIPDEPMDGPEKEEEAALTVSRDAMEAIRMKRSKRRFV